MALTAGVANNSANIQTLNLNIALAGANTWAANSSDIVMNGVVSGTNTLTKTGANDLILTAANTYTGVTTISAGTLNVRNNTGLGTTAGGVTVANLAALELQGGISVGAEALTLNGTGVSSGGALRNISGNNTYGGSVTLGSASRINSDADLLTLSGGINGTNLLVTFGGAGNIAVTGAITNSASGILKDGTGTVTLSGTNTYTGTTVLNAGTLRATANTNALGKLATMSLAGGTLVLANDTGLTYGNNATVTGSMQINSDRLTAGAGVTQKLGALDFTTNSTLTVGAGSNVTSGTAGLTFTNRLNLTGGGGAVISVSTNTLLTLAAVTGNNFGFTVQGDGNTTIGGIISAATLTKSGAGTLSLTAANTYAGGTTVNAGTLTLSGSGT
ncbi:MAG: hypothetical protein EBY81_06890, partial [Verrucomicrobia bacterium]|nr:hypothetical protein [Verrucomicrobiota bacterium]